jgi:hypothetical protein
MGAVQLVIAVLKMTPDLIGKLSQSYISYSTKMLDNLSAQKSDAIIGLTLVSLAFVLNLVSEIYDFSSADLQLTNKDGFLIIILFSLIIYLMSRIFHRFLRRLTRINAGKALLYWQVKEQWFKHQKLRAEDVNRIERSAKVLLFFERDRNETDIEFLKRLSTVAEVDIIERIKERYHMEEHQIAKSL